jgi:hypothetical protein
MQMQMHSGDALSINTGLPEVPGLPVVPDATVCSESLPLSHPPTAPASAHHQHFLTHTPDYLSTIPHLRRSKTMRMTLVPPADIKPLTEEEVTKVKGWMARDKEYEAVYRGMKERWQRSCGCTELRRAICGGK